MAKKQGKKQKPQVSPVQVTIPDGMSSEEMQHLISRAIVEAEEIKEQKAKEKREKESANWRAFLGIKDFSGKKLIVRGIRTFLNRLWCVIKMPFLSKQKVTGDRATFGLLQSSLFVVMSLASMIAFAAFAFFFIGGIVSLVVFIVSGGSWFVSLQSVLLGLGCYLFFGIFHVAGMEIEKIEDRNYLLGIFASFASIISIIIAVIAIVKGG